MGLQSHKSLYEFIEPEMTTVFEKGCNWGNAQALTVLALAANYEPIVMLMTGEEPVNLKTHKRTHCRESGSGEIFNREGSVLSVMILKF